MSKWSKYTNDLKGFIQSTCLHGYAYTADGRSAVEIGFWVVVCLSALVWTAVICADGFTFWRENPVLTT